MSSNKPVLRDERTLAVENASYRWAAAFMAFALLFDVAYRGLVRNEAVWDLLALAMVPGIACLVYHARQNALPCGSLRVATLIALLGGAIASVIAIILTLTKAM